MRRRATPLGCVLALACIAVLTACGTSDEVADLPPTSGPPAAADGAASTRPTTSPSPAAAEPEAAAQERADAAVLRRDDLGGAAWEEEDSSFDEDAADGDPEQRSDDPACHHGQDAAGLDPAPEAKARSRWYFSNTEASETVVSSAYVYASEDLAQQALDNRLAAASACVAWNAGGLEGSDYAFSHRQTTFPVDLAAAAFGVEESVGATAFPDVPRMSSYLVVARTGEVVQTTSFVSSLAGAPQQSMVLTHARSAAERLQR